MNYARLALAPVAAFTAYMILGGLMFGAIPALKDEFRKYPDVYGKMFKSGSGVVEGATFGALIGLYAIGSFVLHNYVNLNIGLRITVVSAIAYFVEWTVVGIVIGLVYKAAN